MTGEKLVRDRIPELMTRCGRTPRVRTLDEADYRAALDLKLSEEVGEYLRHDGSDIEELADVLEVIDAICRDRGIAQDALLRTKRDKRTARGGFEKRLSLTLEK